MKLVKWNMKDIVLFGPVILGDSTEEIKNINFKKSWTSNGIPTKILKISSNNVANVLQNLLNEALVKAEFPEFEMAK